MKGITKVFESIIAILIILTIFITFYRADPITTGFDVAKWRLQGLNALKSLDGSNELRGAAYANDTATIEARLDKFIPPNLDYTVQVCSLNCTKPTINARTATSVEYLISSSPNNYAPRQIVLLMWSNE
jgi:hypothetical protein